LELFKSRDGFASEQFEVEAAPGRGIAGDRKGRAGGVSA